MNENKTNINWYPGHMAKTKKQIIQDLKLIDVIVEIIDARIPISSQNPDVKGYSKNKKRVQDSTLISYLVTRFLTHILLFIKANPITLFTSSNI